MAELEEKLGSILNNPQMMQQIMGMAQMLSGGQQQPKEEKKPTEQAAPEMPAIDPKMLQAIAGIAHQSGTDQQQQGLLKALQPYLSRERINKLERAMSAARMARAASAFLNAGGLQMLTRR